MGKHQLIKNTLMLYGLTAAKILLPLLTIPYLTRILSLEVFGLVVFVKAIMQYLQLWIDYGFSLSGTKAIAQVRFDKAEIGKIAGNILIARIILSLIGLCFIGLMILYVSILQRNTWFVMLSAISTILSIFLFDYIFRGIEKMEVLTIRFVIMKGISTALTFIVVSSDQSIMWLPILDIAGTCAAILLTLMALKTESIYISLSEWKRCYFYLKESTVYFLSNFATTAFMALNTVLIGLLLSQSDVAYWGIVMQIVVGIQAFYSSFIEAVYPRMVVKQNIDIIKQSLMVYMPAILIGCTLLYYLGPQILFLVGGEKYIDASPILRASIPLLIVSFPAMLLGWPTLGVIGKAVDVTKTTWLAAIIQVMGVFGFFFFGVGSILALALFRGLTEGILLVSRLILLINAYKKRRSGEEIC